MRAPFGSCFLIAIELDEPGDREQRMRLELHQAASPLGANGAGSMPARNVLNAKPKLAAVAQRAGIPITDPVAGLPQHPDLLPRPTMPGPPTA